jgi:hypothetical protein
MYALVLKRFLSREQAVDSPQNLWQRPRGGNSKRDDCAHGAVVHAWPHRLDRSWSRCPSTLEGHWPDAGGGICGKNVLEAGPVALSTCGGG